MPPGEEEEEEEDDEEAEVDGWVVPALVFKTRKAQTAAHAHMHNVVHAMHNVT